MGHHGAGHAAVYLAGHEVAVDEELHGPPDIADGEGVQLPLRRGCRVQDDGQGSGRSFEDLEVV